MRAFFIKYGFAIFWLIAVIDFVFIYFELNNARYFTKPLLMPMLLITLFSKVDVDGRTTSKLLLSGALFAATAGDVILLNANGFTGGLIFFLVALFLYTIYFVTIQGFSVKHVVPLVFISALLLSGFSLIIASLWNYIDGFKIPLIVYSIILLTMLVAAINVFNNSETKLLAVDAFIPGAILFVISDVTLATNKFYFEEPFLNLVIMATYCGAQYYICRGCVKELQRNIQPEEFYNQDAAPHQQFNLN